VISLPAAFPRIPWGLVVVRGPDATSFLQAVVSPDLDPVRAGEAVASLLLHPQGKLDVAFRATCRTRIPAGTGGGGDGDEWWLDTEPLVAERLAAGLARFRIRVKVEIDDRTSETGCLTVVGAREVSLADGAGHEDGATANRWSQRIPTLWGDAAGVDLIGPARQVAAWVQESGLRVGGAEELEVLRIMAGIPAQGVDVDDTTIPQEAFLEREAVSFTKGCFIGQELVCRIDTRGHVNRFLRRVELAGPTVPERGAEVSVAGKVVGAITSAASVPGEDRVVALAMLRREVEPPAEVTVAVAGQPSPAHVIA